MSEHNLWGWFQILNSSHNWHIILHAFIFTVSLVLYCWCNDLLISQFQIWKNLPDRSVRYIFIYFVPSIVFPFISISTRLYIFILASLYQNVFTVRYHNEKIYTIFYTVDVLCILQKSMNIVLWNDMLMRLWIFIKLW